MVHHSSITAAGNVALGAPPAPRGDGSLSATAGGQGRPLGSGQAAPLGIYGRFVSTPMDTGFVNPGHERRLHRFMLQATARDVLQVEALSSCCRVRVASDVEVWKSRVSGRATYHNLATCGSVWNCPVCSAKISEKRRTELQAAIDANQVQDEDAYTWLLTLTFPHTKADDLGEILEKLRKAYKRLVGGRVWLRIKDHAGLVGTAVALEVTHGQNGWHPHLHVLGFCQGQEGYRQDREFLSDLQTVIFQRWAKCCEAVGLPIPSEEHGVKLHGGDKAAGYVAKYGEVEGRTWGLPEELTRAHTKKGRNGSRTPWDLLRCIFENETAEDVALFREYARVFRGRRQLRWSPGLRQLLGLGVEQSDEEVAGELDDGAGFLGSITADQWRIVVRREERGWLLYLADTEGWSAVERYLRELEDGEGELVLSVLRSGVDRSG